MHFFSESQIDMILQHLGYYLRLVSAGLVFVGLYSVLMLIYNILAGRSKRAFIFAKKFHFQYMCFVFFFSLWWLLLDLPSFDYQPGLVTFVRGMMMFFVVFLLLDIITHFLTDIYLAKDKIQVPHIIVNFVRTLYVIGLVLFVLSMVYNIDVRPFLTGSAILTAIIGLALQDTLGNLFSGLALHVSRPIDVGHWIKFNDIEGVVTKIDWRATTIKTRKEDYVTIPNSNLSKSVLNNYSTPTTLHGIHIEIGVRYEYPPNVIKRTLTEAILTTEGVVRDVPPFVSLVKYNDFSIDYLVRFFISEYKKSPAIKSAVMEKIWYLFRREGIEIPFPIRDVYIKPEVRKGLDRTEVTTLLSSIDFLEALPPEAIGEVIDRIKPVVYSEGEYVIKQGEEGDTFFIINNGRVEVSAVDPNNDVFLLKTMEKGSFFGEISALTGEPRSASVKALTDTELFMLRKDDFNVLLKRFPDMDQKISEKIAARQKHSFEQKELAKSSSSGDAQKKANKQVDSLSKQLLYRIRDFFSITHV
jgi:small-conductance mechanosensitive channel/CRP-like cAMP-binding protein